LQHETFCRATLAKLENFEYKCKKNIANSENFGRFLDRSVVGLNQVSEKYKGYAGDLVEIKARNSNVCPLKKVLVWVQSEILDFYGVLDQMKEILELKKMKEKITEKVANDKKNLQNFQSGKKTFIQKISKKSESDTLADAEKNVEESNKCLEMVEKVIQITAFRLVKNVMPCFKTKKLETFKNMVEFYIRENSEDLNGFIAQADQILAIF
jgi:soluble cytochrome b562